MQNDTHPSHAEPDRAVRRIALALAACALAATGSALAQATSRPLTGGMESGTDLVTLPASPSGSLLARECRDCPTLRLEFDGDTRYYIGNERVSYARLVQAASQADARRLYVSWKLGTRTLTRLRLAAAGNTE